MARYELPEPVEYKRVILKQKFVGANHVKPEGRQKFGYYSNFFYGNDSSKWRTEVPNYCEIYYENLYDGIDLRYYTNENGLKYDLIVYPGADVEQIRIKYEGANGLEIYNLGNLIIKTKIKDIIDGELFIYQNVAGSRHQIDGKFKIYDNLEYGFELLDDYRPQEILVIDPRLRLEYSTYIGGYDIDCSFSIEVDHTGNAFVTGCTYSSDFPTTSGVYNETFSGEWDIFIFKLDQNGSALLFNIYWW